MKYLTFFLLFFFVPSAAGAATFGKSDIGGTSGDQSSGYVICSSYTSPEDGTAIGITMYYAGIIGTEKTGESAIYSDNAGVPENLLARSDTFEIAAGWNFANISLAISASTTYWLCNNNNDVTAGHSLYVYDAGGTNQFRYDSVNPSGNCIEGCPPDEDAFSNPFVLTGSSNRAMSIYVTYTTSSGAGSSTPATTQETLVWLAAFFFLLSTFFGIIFYFRPKV